MNSQDYLSTLKNLNLRPNKVKIKERKEVVLNETVMNDDRKDLLQELFVQTAEIEATAAGKDRDMQILRLSIIAELDAANLYEKFAVLATDEKLKKVLLDIAKEEKVHVGEFDSMLSKIDVQNDETHKEGADEVEKI